MSDEVKLNELMVGKTVVKVEKWETGITIHFDDGTEINIRSSGSEETWLTVHEV
jgi:hypothetical protein